MADQKDLSEEIAAEESPQEFDPSKNTDNKNRIACLTYQDPRGEDTWSSSNIQNDIVQMVRMLSRANKLISTFPEFFENIRTYRYHDNDPRIVLSIDEKKQVTVVSRDYLQAQMVNFYDLLFKERYFGATITLSSQKSVTEAIMEYLPRLERDEIQAFCFANENDYCWQKLDWKLLTKEHFCFFHEWNQNLGADTSLTPLTVTWKEFQGLFEEWSPAWASILKRATNAEAFAAWLGSLMKKDCRNTQYVYLQGEGNDSKGSIINALLEIFGPKLSHSESIPKPDSGQARFYSGSLEGKRLVASPETNPAYLFSEWFKGLTGGDALAVEKKGQQIRNSPNNARFINAGNPLADFEFDEATKRRLILVTLRSVPSEERVVDFYKKLVDEACFFFSIAYFVFLNMPKETIILQDMEVYDHNFEAVNADLIDILSDIFYFTEDARHEYSKLESGQKVHFRHMTCAEFDKYIQTKLPRFKKKRILETLDKIFHVAWREQLDYGSYSKPKCRMGISPRYLSALSLMPQDDPYEAGRPPVDPRKKRLSVVQS